MDIWWSREQAAHKRSVDFNRVEERPSKPFTIIAVDAPRMKRKKEYNDADLKMLAKKIILIYEVARHLNAPVIFSGLLGGGAYRGHRPLTLLLHLVLQPHGCSSHLKFHHPIFEEFSGYAVSQLEQQMLSIADKMLEVLREKAVATLQGALEEILSWGLWTSNCDSDILKIGRSYAREGKNRCSPVVAPLKQRRVQFCRPPAVCSRPAAVAAQMPPPRPPKQTSFTSSEHGVWY